MHDFSWALHQVNRKKGCTISWNRFSTPDTAFESQLCKETKPTTDFKNEFKNWVGCSFTHDGSVEGINPASHPPSRNTLYPIYARAPKWLFPIRGGMLRSLLQGGASWNLRKNLVIDTSQLVQRRCDQLGHIIFFWRSHSKSMLLLPTQKPWCQCQSSRACSNLSNRISLMTCLYNFSYFLLYPRKSEDGNFWRNAPAEWFNDQGG